MGTETYAARRREDAVVPSSELALALFILTELMFFAGLISAFLVLRADGSNVWPPAGQPRLPTVVTGLNTVVLILSGVAIWRAARRNERHSYRWLALATLLGATFLAIQGIEWVRLIMHGLTLTSSLYGGTFYVLIGAHGAHVLGGLIALIALSARMTRSGTSATASHGLILGRMYWLFVVGIWPVLYGLVYF